MERIFCLSAILMLISFSDTAVFAGGPLATRDGDPVVHNSSSFPISYEVDLGSLGPLDNLQATALVDECFSKWEDVSTSSIYFSNSGYIQVDVDASNYGVYLYSNDGINQVVFDHDGSIMDAVYGVGGKESVLGFASFSSGSSIGEVFVALNGEFADVPGNPGVLKATIVHELGHFMGLDHSQINTQYAQNGDPTDDKYVPTMFPFQTDNDTSVAELNPDDEAALTLLYPIDETVTDSVYGKISGTVKRADGSPVLGANVVAVMVGNEDMNQFSSVSDYYRQSTGEFEMYVLPGTYKIFIEPINKAFTLGSSVGPYAETLVGFSFVNPVTKEYYNGPNESAVETDLNAYLEIIVSAGAEVTGVDFIAEDNAAADLWAVIFELFFWIFVLMMFGSVISG